MADWYYIGNYGQLGPLTRDQVDELIEGGVITRETFVWRSGMSQWLAASGVAELGDSFKKADPYMSPPPPPMPQTPPPMTLSQPMAQQQFGQPYGTGQSWTPAHTGGQIIAYKSDKSRVLAGMLNLIPPGGIGRLYLGYSAYGVLQLVLGLLTCVGYIWSVIDGIVMLSGGVKYDGYGRSINE